MQKGDKRPLTYNWQFHQDMAEKKAINNYARHFQAIWQNL